MSRGASPREVPRWRALIVKLALVVLSSVVALACAEAIVHLAGLAPPAGLFTVSEEEYARLPGIFSPNQSVIEGSRTRFVHRTRIDSLGYRGPDFPRVKEEGEFRVLYVGDSFTYGHNVGDDETLPAQLELQLSSVCVRPRVINAGLSGSTIVGEDVMALRGLSVAPDLVVLMYHENDIDELMGAPMWSQLTENRRIKSRFPASLVYRLVRRSALWNLAQDARRSVLFQPTQREVQLSDLQASVEAVAAAHREYGEHLAALADTLRQRDLPFVFVLFPHPESVREARGGRDYDRIRATAERLRLPTVDLLGPIQRSGASVEDAYLVPEDYHPSAKGYSIAAQHVREVVLAVARPASCRTR